MLTTLRDRLETDGAPYATRFRGQMLILERLVAIQSSNMGTAFLDNLSQPMGSQERLMLQIDHNSGGG